MAPGHARRSAQRRSYSGGAREGAPRIRGGGAPRPVDAGRGAFWGVGGGGGGQRGIPPSQPRRGHRGG
eukprot:5880626-Pleurochrysis_carterae.AAC.1